MTYAIGLDLGGTNIKGLAVTVSGRVLAEEIASTGSSGGRTWIQNVDRVLRSLQDKVKRPASCVGLAAPGLAARDHRSIAFMPERLPGLENLIWQKQFRLPSTVPVLNDAHAALLGEVWRGAARGSENVLLLTLGTGVGGAAIVDGRLLRGQIGRAGHFGHISLDPMGSPDITGAPGSLEDAIGDCTIRRRTGDRFSSTRELVRAARKNNRQAQRIWLTSVRALAAGVCSLINALDPEVIILGGGITQAGAALFVPLSKFLNEFEWRPGGTRARIVRAQLGDRAGAFGAAWQALQSNLPAHLPARPARNASRGSAQNLRK
jgi:glucokinase